jgi:hypothetical protein
MPSSRRTLKQKRRHQRVIEHRRATELAVARDERDEAERSAAWKRFVATRYPDAYGRWLESDEAPPDLEPAAPACADACGRFIRDFMAARNIEATISHLAPLVRTPYDMGAIWCPHGVAWYGEPTSDQVARWAKAGVR